MTNYNKPKRIPSSLIGTIGIYVKESVKVATTTSIDLLNVDTIDSIALIALTAGDRVLVKDQSTATQNGVYTYAGTGLERATAFADGDTVTRGAYFFVEDGTINKEKGFVLEATANVGTDDVILIYLIMSKR